MKRADLTEKILDIKREKGWTWKYICERDRRHSPVLIVGALLGQMKLVKPQAAKAAELFGLSKSEQAMLNEVPMRGAGVPMPPTDPLIYRFYELVLVNGPAWKALIEEEFGDGIMSAIDFDMADGARAEPEGRPRQDHHVGQVPAVQILRQRAGTCRSTATRKSERAVGRSAAMTHRSYPKKAGFRLGVYVCKDAEIVDFAAPHGVFSVARRFDPELDAFLVAEALRPVQAQAGFTVLPNYGFGDAPDMDAFLIPGGFGLRQEINNGRLHDFIRALPEKTLLTSVCTGSWVYGRMGLLDGRARPTARSRTGSKRPTWARCRSSASPRSRPKCRISRARVVDAGRIISAGGIASGMEMGFHLLRRAGYDEAFIADVARVMEYKAAYELYRDDIEYDG